MTSRPRIDAIRELEQLRGSRVICYVTSTRNGLDARMAPDVIPVVYRHLQAIGKVDTIDLFIHSNGGEGIVPWRLVTLIREFCEHFNVLVPHLAYSAATLTALGADTVVMHPMGVLGPTDPTITTPYNPRNESNPAGPPMGIAVEDVTSYFALVKDDVGIRHEDELVKALTELTSKVHPLALGNVKRTTLQSRMLGKSLLGTRKNPEHQLTEQQIVEIVERLTSQLFFHGHPINRTEAREEIGLTFVTNATDEEEALLWEMYQSFDEEMLLETAFNVLVEALEKNPAAANPQPAQVVQTPQGMMQVPGSADIDLDDMLLAQVQSTERTDAFWQKLRVSLIKQPVGYQVNAIPIKAGWAQVTSAESSGATTPGMGPEMGDDSGEATGTSSQPDVITPNS